ncbi:cell division protein SepF [Rhodococcus aerolatus]
MSSLHKLKAYFGMVPVDGDDVDYDGYDAEYETEYARDRDADRRDRPREGWSRREESWDDRESLERHREPALAGARSGRSSHDGGLEAGGYDRGTREPVSRFDGGSRHDDGEPARPRLDPLPAVGSARRPGGSAPVTRGALAVDPRVESRRDDDPAEQARITTVHPTAYAEAKVVGERFRAGNPVIINLTRMSDADAKRLVDFSAGLAFAMRGSIDKVTTKVFLLSPSAVEFSDEDRRRIVEDGFYDH